jgi:hypothetical protein
MAKAEGAVGIGEMYFETRIAETGRADRMRWDVGRLTGQQAKRSVLLYLNFIYCNTLRKNCLITFLSIVVRKRR